MGLAEELKEARAMASNGKCTFVRILNQLSEDDAREIQLCLGAKVKDYVIIKILRNSGYKIAGDGVTVHQTQKCRCFRSEAK